MCYRLAGGRVAYSRLEARKFGYAMCLPESHNLTAAMRYDQYRRVLSS
jgi:hypothetical protein